MAEETKKGSGGLDLALAVWHRRKWLAILIFLVPFTAAVSLALFLPDLYQATATVLVERQLVPENFVQPTVTSALETRLHTISQEILSRSRLEALVNRFGLYPELRKKLSTDEVIESMRRDIKLELKSADVKGQERQATVAFAISYRGVDPNTVALVTNTLASFYIEENLKVRQRQAVGTTEFLQVQLDETKKKVDEQEKQVSEFKRRYLGELPQQMDANMATLERLNMQLRMNVDGQTRASERRQLLASQLAETKSDEKGEPKPVVPSSPYVMRLREAKSEADSDAKVLKSEEKRLRDGIAVYQSRLDNVPRREQEFREFSRDYESTRNLYQTLLKRYEEAQLAESMEQRQKGEQFRILDPAVPSQTPAAPNRFRLFVVSLVLSLGLAGGALVFAEMLDTSFHSVKELREFSIVPVLVSIPRIVTDADRHRQQRWLRLAAAGTMLGLVLIAGASYFIGHRNEQLVQMLAGSGS